MITVIIIITVIGGQRADETGRGALKLSHANAPLIFAAFQAMNPIPRREGAEVAGKSLTWM